MLHHVSSLNNFIQKAGNFRQISALGWRPSKVVRAVTPIASRPSKYGLSTLITCSPCVPFCLCDLLGER
jgi:hypothetical protein